MTSITDKAKIKNPKIQDFQRDAGLSFGFLDFLIFKKSGTMQAVYMTLVLRARGPSPYNSVIKCK